MSGQKRKLSYFSIDFIEDDHHFFDANLFRRLINYVDLLPDEEKLFNDTQNNKAISLDEIKLEKRYGKRLCKMVFKSCKYNHAPDYMSSKDGSERPTDKKMHEGDKELTHICMRLDEAEAYTIFEERRNGVTIGGAIKYFNILLRGFLLEEDMDDNIYLYAGNIPPDDFLTTLDSAERIMEAELFIEKKILGSEYLGLMNVDANVREDLILTAKAKPRESLSKRAIKKTFSLLSTSGTEVNRIRLYGKDINKMNVIIDSLNLKKVNEIDVALRENGTVDSYSIFSKMEEILGEVK